MKWYQYLMFWKKDNSQVEVENVDSQVQTNDVLELVPDIKGIKRERKILEKTVNEKGVIVVISTDKPV